MASPAAFLILSDRAYTEIINETVQNISTETGGVLLGVKNDDQWYALESLDPGPRAILRPAYFEYDDAYMTHLANKVRLRYRTPLTLLGLWHRHPGSFDRFSSTDDETNATFARICGGTAISGLINLDPTFRMTFYIASGKTVKYQRSPVEVGDKHIPAEYLRLRTAADLLDSLSNASGSDTRSGSKQNVAIIAGELAPSVTRPRSQSGIGNLFSWLRTRRQPELERADRVPLTIGIGQTSPDRGAGGLLDRIEEELLFLEAQRDYSYELRPEIGGLRVVLKRAVNIRECPPELEFSFVYEQKVILVRFAAETFNYQPGILRLLINRLMSGDAR